MGGIATVCLSNALRKYYAQLMKHSFQNQTSRLKEAGYPERVLVSIAERQLKRIHGSSGQSNTQHHASAGTRSTAVIPCIDQLSHNLKEVALRDNIGVFFFSVPGRLRRLR